jgi:hypothetical protein
VDAQLEDFEEDLRNQLEFHLMLSVNRDFWREMDHLSTEDERGIEDVIDFAIQGIMKRYENSRDVTNIFQHLRILIQNVVWASMNVPWPRDPNVHIGSVVENAMQVYYNVVYPQLRTEMIMVNHHCEVIQRNWLKCYYEPDHPVCKRRLVREFEELVS